VENDSAVAAYIMSALSAVRAALVSLFSRKSEEDVRNYGAVGDGIADDTAAVQAAINAAGSDGVVKIPWHFVCLITSPLDMLAGTSIRGAWVKSSELRASTDITMIRASGGQGQAIRQLLVRNTLAGARTTYDIDITNPTKSVLSDVEVSLPNESTGGGGIRFRKDTGVAGNAFMPQLTRVWVRNGHVVIDGVTDGHAVDCFFWSPYTGARATVDMSNIANGWTFSAVDVVPPQGSGDGYRIEQTWDTNIVGGYLDGSYTDILTGNGIHLLNGGQLFVSATRFYHLGRSGIVLENSSGSSFAALGFHRNNKQDAGYPDIELINSSHNTFLGTGHRQPVVRTNKGAIYREDSTSLHNSFDEAAYDISAGDNYAKPLFVGNAGTLGKRNRPGSLWPRPSGVPLFLNPPVSMLSIPSAVAWAAANRAQFHRFHLTDGGVFRYANVRVESGSGNIQVAVVRMDGLNYTRVMDSGVIACTTGMPGAIDMGATHLPAGEYALVVWLDNTTATLRVANDEMVRVTRGAAEVSSLSSGVPSSGSISAWNSTRAVQGCALTVS
jgi:hypothetical protein